MKEKQLTIYIGGDLKPYQDKELTKPLAQVSDNTYVGENNATEVLFDLTELSNFGSAIANIKKPDGSIYYKILEKNDLLYKLDLDYFYTNQKGALIISISLYEAGVAEVEEVNGEYHIELNGDEKLITTAPIKLYINYTPYILPSGKTLEINDLQKILYALSYKIDKDARINGKELSQDITLVASDIPIDDKNVEEAIDELKDENISLLGEITKILNGSTVVKKAQQDDEGQPIKTTYVKHSQVVNSLLESTTDNPLSALQGKLLNEKILTIQDILESDDTDLDTIQEMVDYVKENKNLIDELTENTVALVNITWSNLKALRDSGQLRVGREYRITDYTTTIVASSSTSVAGNNFDIIVVADSETTLNEKARAIKRVGDTYFTNAGANLSAWEIWYCLDNDNSRFQWANSSQGKGVIYRMIDEWGNDVPFDFKNIQFQRWRNTSEETFENRFSRTDNGGVSNYYYLFSVMDENEVIHDCSTNLTFAYVNNAGETNRTMKNIFLSTRRAYNDSDTTKQRLYLPFNVFVFDYNLYGAWNFVGFKNNNLWYFFNNNTIGTCYNNTLANNFYNNTIGTFYNNTVANGFANNTLVGSHYRTNYGPFFQFNTFQHNCYYNTFRSGVQNNDFLTNFGYNVVGDDVRYCAVSINGVYRVKIENGIKGASELNKLELSFSGLNYRAYPTTFTQTVGGQILALWEANEKERTGVYKESNTSTTWLAIENILDGGEY